MNTTPGIKLVFHFKRMFMNVPFRCHKQKQVVPKVNQYDHTSSQKFTKQLDHPISYKIKTG